MDVNKVRVFLMAFVVGTLLVYMFYYYGRTRMEPDERAVLIQAEEYPSLKVGACRAEGQHVWHFGTGHALSEYSGKEGYPYATRQSPYGVHFAGLLTGETFDRLNGEVADRLLNHPPLDFFKRVGEYVLFTYYLRNITIPAGVRDWGDSMTWLGKRVPALRVTYDPAKPAIRLFGDGEEGWKLKIGLEEGDTLEWKNKDVSDSTAWPQQLTLLIPRIDIYLEKTYTQSDIASLCPGLERNPFTFGEFRLKLKTTAPQRAKGETIPKVKLQPLSSILPLQMNLSSGGEGSEAVMLHFPDHTLLLEKQ